MGFKFPSHPNHSAIPWFKYALCALLKFTSPPVVQMLNKNNIGELINYINYFSGLFFPALFVHSLLPISVFRMTLPELGVWLIPSLGSFLLWPEHCMLPVWSCSLCVSNKWLWQTLHFYNIIYWWAEGLGCSQNHLLLLLTTVLSLLLAAVC